MQLYSAPTVHIDDVTVVTGIAGRDGIISFKVATNTDYNGRGKAVLECIEKDLKFRDGMAEVSMGVPLIVRDYELLRWVGANSYRTAHYPYSEEAMMLADKLGVLVIDEIPAVSLGFADSGDLIPRRFEQYTSCAHAGRESKSGRRLSGRKGINRLHSNASARILLTERARWIRMSRVLSPPFIDNRANQIESLSCTHQSCLRTHNQKGPNKFGPPS